MSKYKLKKWYPSLPADWKEGMKVGQGDRGNCSWYSSCDASYTDEPNSRLSIEEVEDNPEFWEKVVEKDYKILSMCDNNGLNICFIENELQSKLLYHGGFNIYSIKRLSDGEVFTIGDYVMHHILNGPHPIKKIPLIKGILKFRVHSIEGHHSYFKKAPKLLFTTEDGIDVFEGTGYWYVQDGSNPTNHHYPNQVRYTTISGIDRLDLSDKGVKRFSTKEAAEDYILMNKPCLSLKDFKDIIKNRGGSYLYNSTWISLLKEKIKSKQSL